MLFPKLVDASKAHFPNLNIKYKNESILMKILKIILFFNPSFYENFTTVIGNTIYFSSKENVLKKDLSCSTILLHELIHIYDGNRTNKLWFGLTYLFPQILVLIGLPMLFVSWKIALIFLIFLLPLPAYWRMKYEKKAYIVSLYIMKKMEEKIGVNFFLNENKKHFIKNFTGPNYYFMWYLPGLSKEFDDALIKIERNEKPFEDPSLYIIDNILEKV